MGLRYFRVSIPTWASHRLQEAADEVGEDSEVSLTNGEWTADEVTIG